jgi:hypothetical protein
MKKNYEENDLIGTWKSPDPTNGYQAHVTISFAEDHILHYVFEHGSLSSTAQTTWVYDRNILTETTRYGTICRGALQWMSDDYFILTILENGSEEYKGIKRHYHRVIEKPVPSKSKSK